MKLLFLFFNLLFAFGLDSAVADDLQKQIIQKSIKELERNIKDQADFLFCRGQGLHRTDMVDLRNSLSGNAEALEDLQRATLKIINSSIIDDQKRLNQLTALAAEAISKEVYAKVVQDAEEKLDMAYLNRAKLVEQIKIVSDYNHDVSQEHFANKERLFLPSMRKEIVELRENFCSKISSLNTVASMLIDLYQTKPAYDFDKISFTLQGALNGSVIYELNIPVYDLENNFVNADICALRFDIDLIKEVLGDGEKEAIKFVTYQSMFDRIFLFKELRTEDVRFKGRDEILIMYNKTSNGIVYPSKSQIENVLFLMLGIKNDKLRLYKNNK